MSKGMSGREAFGTFITAIAAITTSKLADAAFFTNEGRGKEITACPEGYKPMVRLNSADALGALAVVARENHIHDSFASDSRKEDLATLPGELACKITATDLTSSTYLLPAGQEALQRSADFEPISGKLPNGLEWVSQPGK